MHLESSKMHRRVYSKASLTNIFFKFVTSFTSEVVLKFINIWYSHDQFGGLQLFDYIDRWRMRNRNRIYCVSADCTPTPACTTPENTWALWIRNDSCATCVCNITHIWTLNHNKLTHSVLFFVNVLIFTVSLKKNYYFNRTYRHLRIKRQQTCMKISWI